MCKADEDVDHFDSRRLRLGGTRISLGDERKLYLSNYLSRTMDKDIRLGREVNNVNGSDWIAYARGMAITDHLEQYRIDSESHAPLAMILGENMSGAIAGADKLLELKGTDDSDAGYNKSVVKYLVKGGP